MHTWTAHTDRDWIRAMWPLGAPPAVARWIRSRVAFDLAVSRDEAAVAAVRAIGLGSQRAVARLASSGQPVDAVQQALALGCEDARASWRAALGELPLDEVVAAATALEQARSEVEPEDAAQRALVEAERADAAWRLARRRGVRAAVLVWAGDKTADATAVLEVGPVLAALESAAPTPAVSYLRAWALTAPPSDQRDALAGAEELALAAEGSGAFSRRARFALYNHLIDAGRGPAANALLDAALQGSHGVYWAEAALVRAESLQSVGDPAAITLLDQVLSSDRAAEDSALRQEAIELMSRSLLLYYGRTDDGEGARAALELRRRIAGGSDWVLELGMTVAEGALGIGTPSIASELYDWLCSAEPLSREHPLWRYTALTLGEQQLDPDAWDVLIDDYAAGTPWAEANRDDYARELASTMAAAARERQALLAHQAANADPSPAAWAEALARYALLAQQHQAYYVEQGVVAFHARAWLDADEAKRAAQLIRRRPDVPDSAACEAWAVDLEVVARTPRHLHPSLERIQAAADSLGGRCSRSARDAAYVWRLAEVASRRTRARVDYSTLVTSVWPRLSSMDQAMLGSPRMLERSARRHPMEVYEACEELEPDSDAWAICDQTRARLRRSGRISDDRTGIPRQTH